MSKVSIRFRFHRGGFEDSMSTCVDIDTIEDIEALIAEAYGYEPPLEFIFEPRGIDVRNGWDTHLIMCRHPNGISDLCPVGWSDAIPPSVPRGVAPTTPEVCLNCGASYSGGATRPGDDMVADLRVFYMCGASVCLRPNPDDPYPVYLKNCSGLPDNFKVYKQDHKGGWTEQKTEASRPSLSTDQINDIRNCIGLLNSMVRGGESHSDVSKLAVEKALRHLNGD